VAVTVISPVSSGWQHPLQTGRFSAWHEVM